MTIDRARLILAAVLGVALTALTWWLVGDLSSPGFAPGELDYMFRAPDTFERHTTSVGLGGAAIAIACLVLLLWMYFRGDVDRRGVVVIGSLAAAGVYLGFAARTVTAGGIGANIGAGLVVMIGLAGLVALAFSSRRSRIG